MRQYREPDQRKYEPPQVPRPSRPDAIDRIAAVAGIIAIMILIITFGIKWGWFELLSGLEAVK
jgi:hypothetical protein